MDVNKSIFRFILLTILASVPLLVLTGIYASLDPFNLLRPARQPYPREAGLPYSIGAANFIVLKQLPDSLKPNAFIFGSSRSQFIPVEEWKRYLGPDAKPFHLDGSSENIDAIHRKVRWLNRNGYEIKYALIETAGLSFTAHKPSVVYALPPELTSWGEVVANQYFGLRFFLDKDVFFGCLAFLRGDTTAVLPFPLTPRVNHYTRNTNEIIEWPSESYAEITDELGPQRTDKFEPYDQSDAKMVADIIDVFEAHGTQYQFFVSPTLEPNGLTPVDIAALRRDIPEGHFSDLSNLVGVDPVVSDTTLWLNRRHYSPFISAHLLRLIYEGR